MQQALVVVPRSQDGRGLAEESATASAAKRKREVSLGGREMNEAEESSEPAKGRRLERLRLLVKNALETESFATAVWYADKLVTLSQGKAEDVLLLARSLYASGDASRAARTLQTRKSFGVPGQPIAQCVVLLL